MPPWRQYVKTIDFIGDSKSAGVLSGKRRPNNIQNQKPFHRRRLVLVRPPQFSG
jgi:hypothetical protein